MKLKNLLQIILVLCMSKSVAQIVTIPDQNFKTALLNHDPVIDTNEDGEIQLSEAEAFGGAMDIFDQSISDLTGVESFINIEMLLADFNNIEQLDVSQNTALKRLSLTANQLAEIDISQNTNLTLLWLAGNVNISSLDLSQNAVLDTLSIQGLSSLTQLDMSQNTELIYVRGDAVSLTELDISHNTGLRHLNLRHNQLSEINTSQNTELNFLSIGSNQLMQLDVSENPLLTTLGVDDNQLLELNLANGNNENLSLYAIDNPDLSCIQVDSGVIGNIPGSWEVDPGTTFSDDCEYLGINENDPLSVISLYPNPATSHLTIDMPENIEIKNSYINNILEQAFNAKIQEKNVDVSALKTGLYFITIETNKGSVVKKFIKE